VTTEILVGWAPLISGLDLKTGTHGVFKVFLDDELVFDKAQTRRMPLDGELAATFTNRLGPSLKWRKDRTGTE
jgi:predicted Rdx family selenoprotein